MKVCIKCERRYPACQDTCPDRAKELAEFRARQEKIKKAKDEGKQNRDYIYERYHKGRQT